MKPEPVFSLDYLRFSVPHGFDLGKILPRHDAFKFVKHVRPLRNYDKAEDWNSARIDINTTRAEQGSLVTMAGTQLEQMRLWGMTDRDIIAFVANDPAIKVNRVDLAMDLFGWQSNPWDIRQAFDKGELQTRAKAYQVIFGRDENTCTGMTVYLGSRTSQAFLRVYDKGAERGADYVWTRCEMECKGDYARNVLTALKTNSLIDVTKTEIRRFCRGVQWLDEATYGKTGRLVRPGARKLTNTEKWIVEVALPAIVSAYKNRLPEVINTLAMLNGEILPPADDDMLPQGNID